MKITNKNYYSVNNGALTNSKITDWKKDKNFFFRKHISGEVERKVTTDMIIGSAVDTWITGSESKFKKIYTPCGKSRPRTATEFELNDSDYEMVVKICQILEKQDAFKELAKYKKQKIIQFEMEIGNHFNGLCGKPDWYIIKDGICTIVDLKTCRDLGTDKERSYFRHAKDYGYFRQQAMYQIILNNINPNIKEFFSLHLVVEKDNDEIYNCHTFHLDQDRIRREKAEIFEIIEEIKNEKEFAPKNVSFADAITIGAMD